MRKNLLVVLSVAGALAVGVAISKPSLTQPQGGCIPTSGRLCLNDGRFGVEVDWVTPDGNSGRASGELLTDETGYFWFFSEGNVEIVVKVLEACVVNDHHWVFAAGLTNVRATILVEDTVTGSVWTRTNPQGVAFQPIQDTAAFTCSSSDQSAVKVGPVSFEVPEGWSASLANDPTTEAPTSILLEEHGTPRTILVALAPSFAFGLEPFSTVETEEVTVGGLETVQTTYFESGNPYMRLVTFTNAPPRLNGFRIEYRGDVGGYPGLDALLESVDVR